MCVASCAAIVAPVFLTCLQPQNTVKLVAMNLIASGRLFEGVELLFMIDNGLDACRYCNLATLL